MADTNTNGGPDRGSLAAHEQTYGGVITMLKFGTAAAAIIAALVIWMIAT